MEHDEFCNCEDCYWARDQEDICPYCGCLASQCCNNEEYEEEPQ